MLLLFALFTATLLAQSDICLWNIIDDGTASTQYTYANGLYEYKGNYKGNPYYLNNDTSCGSTQSDGVYIYYKLNRWYIGNNPKLVSDSQAVEGLIGGCNTTISPSSATNCNGKWSMPWDKSGQYVDENIQVISTKCPSWTDQCSKINVDVNPSTDDDDDNCEGDFVKDSSFEYDNVYVKEVDSSTKYYWYFNHRSWQLICSSMVDFENCKPSGSDVFAESLDGDYWVDLDVDGTTSVSLENSKSLSVTCSETEAPTSSPTKAPLPPGESPDDPANMLQLNIKAVIIILFSYCLFV